MPGVKEAAARSEHDAVGERPNKTERAGKAELSELGGSCGGKKEEQDGQTEESQGAT
jgi:hypothetical protein